MLPPVAFIHATAGSASDGVHQPEAALHRAGDRDSVLLASCTFEHSCADGICCLEDQITAEYKLILYGFLFVIWTFVAMMTLRHQLHAARLPKCGVCYVQGN